MVSNLTQSFKAEFNSKYNSVSAKTESVFIVLLFHITWTNMRSLWDGGVFLLFSGHFWAFYSAMFFFQQRTKGVFATRKIKGGFHWRHIRCECIIVFV